MSTQLQHTFGALSFTAGAALSSQAAGPISVAFGNLVQNTQSLPQLSQSLTLEPSPFLEMTLSLEEIPSPVEEGNIPKPQRRRIPPEIEQDSGNFLRVLQVTPFEDAYHTLTHHYFFRKHQDDPEMVGLKASLKAIRSDARQSKQLVEKILALRHSPPPSP